MAQLAGYCSEHTAYHHGEQSLHSTIVGMAQDFPGSNNMPLLKPIGQFGTRLTGGKDAASARYIFTALQEYSRVCFPAVDDALLTAQWDDGMQVEPEVRYSAIDALPDISAGKYTVSPDRPPSPFTPFLAIDSLLLRSSSCLLFRWR